MSLQLIIIPVYFTAALLIGLYAQPKAKDSSGSHGVQLGVSRGSQVFFMLFFSDGEINSIGFVHNGAYRHKFDALTYKMIAGRVPVGFVIHTECPSWVALWYGDNLFSVTYASQHFRPVHKCGSGWFVRNRNQYHFLAEHHIYF